MSAMEIALHVRKKLRQMADARRTNWPGVDLTTSGLYPRLPKPSEASPELTEALRHDAAAILAGHWRFFGHLQVQVDDPPRWQCDYLVRRDVRSSASAFDLNYRSLKDGVDSKLIWEPSRWNQLVRLAMAAYVLGDSRAAEKCLAWLENWTVENPPYRGWNWTSALEVGLRLIQFAWIDALLGGFAQSNGDAQVSILKRLEALRQGILAPHVWYAWRHRSFGSSANNHLLGELTGCVVAMARWPGLSRIGPSVDTLQRLWEREVLAQFAYDGGNREQALNYQLFSWEFALQAMHALISAGRQVNEQVHLRLLKAASFFLQMHGGAETWAYGDSDNAYVTPFFLDDAHVGCEWNDWLLERKFSPGVEFWMSEFRAALKDPSVGVTAHFVSRGPPPVKRVGWTHYVESGYCVVNDGRWMLRWDVSPLGYLSTRAHGHLDALHLSIWIQRVAMVIDPGTGAYHADKPLRTWLASRQAHNGPCPVGMEFPRRTGPFLWREEHETPRLELSGGVTTATLKLPGATVRRSIRQLPDQNGWEVSDACEGQRGTAQTFTVRWQFPPGSRVKRTSERAFRICRAGSVLVIEVAKEWSDVQLIGPIVDPAEEQPLGTSAPTRDLEGIVSPAFRQICRAPFLKLTARGDQPCVFTTTFLASAHS
jgi:hypothetical protein